MDKKDLQDVRAQKERRAVQGPRGPQEKPSLFSSKDRKESLDLPALMASLDHEEVKVHKELLVSRGIRASMDLLASQVPQDSKGP